MKPLKLAIIGHPIGHSKSPIIHDYWLKLHDIPGTYETIDIDPENLESEIKNIIEQSYNGFSVTIPHKENIINFCDEITDSAHNIGAVNTVTIKDGNLAGTNTDYYGFIENIKSNTVDFGFNNKTALLLGAGGAARAIIYGLLQENIAHIYLSNRTRERAESLQNMSPDKITVIDWNDKETILNKTDLLINATSLGMVEKPPLDINLSTLPSPAVVTDIVYTPLMTNLLNQAKTQGNSTVTGVGMLLHQARPAFQSWTGILPGVTSELENILLTG